MLGAESKYQADVEQLVKKHRDRLASLLDGFVNLRSRIDIEPWKRKRRIKTRIFLIGLLTFIVLLILPFVEKNYFTILRFLQQGEWWILSGFFLLLVVASPFALPLIRRRLLESRTIPDKGLELRAMLDDEQLVPLATNQPLILSEDRLPITPTRIGLKHWKTDAVLKLMSVITVTVGVLTTILPQLSFQQEAGFSLSEFIFSVVYLILIILFCGGICLMALVFAWQAPHSGEVVVDASELRWRRPGWGQKSHASIAWHDVQGFYVFVYKDLDRIYFLDGHEITFIWSTNHDNLTDVLNASDRLSSLIVTRTHLPLRDLSMAVAMLLTHRE